MIFSCGVDWRLRFLFLLSLPLLKISQDEFHEIDRRVLGHAFAIHNQFGCLLDEIIYKNELAERCGKDGLTVQREAMIRVCFGDFSKVYFADLLICDRVVVEAKTVRALTDAHRGQGLNYLLLTGTHHGSLINFRTSRVQREFLSTRLTLEMRQQFEISRIQWPEDEAHSRLLEQVISFCGDVGLGLDLQLYRDAFPLLIGRPNKQLVPILSGSKIIGHQEMSMLKDDIAMVVTSLQEVSGYRRHLERLLSTTLLMGLAWVNVKLGVIEFENLKR